MLRAAFKTPKLPWQRGASISFLTSLACLAMSTPLFAATLGQNLIVNGDAEQGVGDPVGNAVGTAIPAIPGWTPTSSFSVLNYGASGFSFVNPAGQLVQVSGLPDATTPGPGNRGNNFFYGGGDHASSSASQTVDFSNLSQTIDNGLLRFSLSGWLGGYQTDADSASLLVSFLSLSGTVLSSANISSPPPLERNNTTGLFFRSVEGQVPVGTRQATVLLDMNYTRGRVNDAYADNLSLTTEAVPEPATILGSLIVGLFTVRCHRRQLRR